MSSSFRKLLQVTFLLQGVYGYKRFESNKVFAAASSQHDNDCPLSCQLPTCSCGLSIPGGLAPEVTPQFILLTFDDAVNDLNKEFYERIFRGRNNPNGCKAPATFYVSHEWTDYGQVQDLYSQGHEIASHSVTHSHPESFDHDRWAKEIVGQADLLVQLANVDPSDVIGMRAPFLQTGGDTMFSILSQFNFLYDSSLPSGNSPALWPYTLDQKPPHSCAIKPCPTGVTPGIWEIPMTSQDDYLGNSCPMLDACRYDENAESIQRMLTKNFLRHYTSNKAPFPMFYHAAWFRLRPHREEGLINFLDSIQDLPDVFFVTSQQLIDWVKQPTPMPGPHPALACPVRRTPPCGSRKKICKYGSRHFYTCSECPSQYPWVG